MKPLGDYEPFRRWSGKPRAWGPEGAGWQAWFGGKVVDGLCEVLDEHLTARRGREMRPAAIGCVPWLTSEAVVDRLLKTQLMLRRDRQGRIGICARRTECAVWVPKRGHLSAR
jgi:hypothetical protein